MIPLMFILGQQLSGSGDGSEQVTPPGTVPSTCVSGCTTPLPEIRNSSGDIVNIGDFWTEQGGYYSGLFTLTGNEVYALILSPKNIGHIYDKTMINFTINLDNMSSSINGLLNTNNLINYMITNNSYTSMPLINDIYNKNINNVGGLMIGIFHQERK